jgi:hypothetical protein
MTRRFQQVDMVWVERGRAILTRREAALLLNVEGLSVLSGKPTAQLSDIVQRVKMAGAGMSGADEQRCAELMSGLGEYAEDVCFDPSERHHPLVLRYLVPEDFSAPLALPKVPSRLEAARAQIAAIALDKACHEQPWVSYSATATTMRSVAGDTTKGRICIASPSSRALAAADFLISEVAPPDLHCGWQSVFRAAPALIEALAQIIGGRNGRDVVG